MSLGRGIQGTNLPTHLLPPPRPLPNPQVTLPSAPPPLCHRPRSRFLPLPLCGACPFVGYCGLFLINYFRKEEERHHLYVTMHHGHWQGGNKGKGDQSLCATCLQTGARHEDTTTHVAHDCPTARAVWAAIAQTWQEATSEPLDVTNPTLTVLGLSRVHVRGGGRCSEQFKTLLNRKKTHSFLNKSCVTNDSESIEHPSENHEKFGRYGTSGTCRGGGISSVKVRRAEIVPRSASEAACHPENTWGPSTDRSRATCAPKSP